jgi:hypothetical protein
MRKHTFGELQKVVTPVTWVTVKSHNQARAYILSRNVRSLSKCGEINNIQKHKANGRVKVCCNLIRYKHKQPLVENLVFIVRRVSYTVDSTPITYLERFVDFQVRHDQGCYRVTIPANMLSYFQGVLVCYPDWTYAYSNERE